MGEESSFATSAEFMELIAQEVYVDIDRLRFLSYYGIPDDQRGSVWRLLLPELVNSRAHSPSAAGSRKARLSGGLSTAALSKFSRAHDPDFSKLIRDAIDHYCPEEAIFRKVGMRERIEKILIQYYADHPDSFAARDPKLLVSLLCPFIFTFGKQRVECEVSWNLFMQLLECHNQPHVKQRHYSRFMNLFRTHLPQLSAKFDEEEMEPRRWVADLHRGLFATQLSSNLKCLLLLWDSYFSATSGGGSGGGEVQDVGFELHIYVCLAIFKLHEGLLLDMNYPEIRGFLDRLDLHASDIPKILAQANNFKLMD